MPVPVIDLFAGPGGLGEGFALLRDRRRDQPFFRLVLSIERDTVAHRTLTLRAVFRLLRENNELHHYYGFIRGEIDEHTFHRIPAVAMAFDQAAAEARCLELGRAEESVVDQHIRSALQGAATWVLIGGPPCQAYSIAGRSRRARDIGFQDDARHFLYREYLRIIREHRPAIFVMENVKGMLSSKHAGNPMFERILADLSAPGPGLEYEIRSFTRWSDNGLLEPVDYVIQSEHHGIPQNRHRVILLGVQRGLGLPRHRVLLPSPRIPTVLEAIGDLPPIRSRLSRGDSLDAWREAIRSFMERVRESGVDRMLGGLENVRVPATPDSTGAAFIPWECGKAGKATAIQARLRDRHLGGICQHEARAHMPSDLARYLFCSCFAKACGFSPRLEMFPRDLLPDHINVHTDRRGGALPFADRFRVQCANGPASTVVSHIAKDGHYYIHHDPAQCRSLTVREAARLQTFPDNYFFMGNRTEQYIQVGNAVPPLLARQLAGVVRGLLSAGAFEGSKWSVPAMLMQQDSGERLPDSLPEPAGGIGW